MSEDQHPDDTIYKHFSTFQIEERLELMRSYIDRMNKLLMDNTDNIISVSCAWAMSQEVYNLEQAYKYLRHYLLERSKQTENII